MLASEDIELTLWMGADVHVAPDLVAKLGAGEVPTLGGSRYFLLEPPHHVMPPRLDELVSALIAAGFVPLVTHPERLGWIESHYEVIEAMVDNGALIQLTAASITGGFGRRAQYWSERMLDEGMVDVIASDAHNTAGRPPVLSAAVNAIARRCGDDAAVEMVSGRPAAILRNEPLPRRQRPGPAQTTTRLRQEGSKLASWVKRLRG
ncbi:MAG: capsular polysaccharide biosynthesis protein [Devosia sp.]|nr:capsular polysaccharide biosynthesis protein [Devosia sp.]